MSSSQSMQNVNDFQGGFHNGGDLDLGDLGNNPAAPPSTAPKPQEEQTQLTPGMYYVASILVPQKGRRLHRASKPWERDKDLEMRREQQQQQHSNSPRTYLSITSPPRHP
ncbi:GL10938 [Drosophila persimilis]|uniref:GL10938 n=1 Tax=Drosophila persimilis TaxID=7234 RepID=B4GCP1_DROPE|nr:GL10938 [Drosophila persimilis]